MTRQLSLGFDHRLGIQVLGSSSAGNATLVWSGGEAVLVDCGFPVRTLERRLRTAGWALPSIRAVLITHTHSDHAVNQTIEAFAAAGIPVIAPGGVRAALRATLPAALIAERRGLLRALPSLRGEAGPFEVEAFPVPHDAPGGCFGYSLAAPGGTITVATDLASAGNGLAACFAGADLMLIESNHDTGMLERSSRPPWLKRRIRERGHLSNEECARFVVEVVEQSAEPPQAVLLAHISRECNTPSLAVGATAQALAAGGWHSVRVLETYPDRVTPPVELP